MVSQPYVDGITDTVSDGIAGRQSRGVTIMTAQILPAGTDRSYAAALDWIKQTTASGTTLSPPGDEGLATEELVAALLPVITSEHATAIVAQQIRETLSAPWPAPTVGVAPADHGTFRYAETVTTVSEICTGCGRYYDLPTEADQVMRAAFQQDGIGRVLVQCKDIEACYERWSSVVNILLGGSACPPAARRASRWLGCVAGYHRSLPPGGDRPQRFPPASACHVNDGS